MFPTLCRLPNVEKHTKPLDGIDLTLSLLEQRKLDRTLFWQMGGRRAFRRGPWKYVKESKEAEMLFNLETDPGETTNLATQHAEILNQLKTRHAAISATFSAENIE